MEIAIPQRVEILLLALSFSFFLFLLVYFLGYFRFPTTYFVPPPKLHLTDVIGVFLVFLGIELLAMPLFLLLFFSFKTGHLLKPGELKLDALDQGWLNLFAIVASCVGIYIYLYLQPEFKRKFILWGSSSSNGNVKNALNNLALGSFTWLISYPCVVMASQIIGIMMTVWGAPIPLEQVAVKQLKTTLADPFLFNTTALVIIFFVPIAEEIIFRGFMQRFLVGTLGRFKGIILASLIFAAFHFAPSQGWQNIELLISLTILAFFLGFLYERQGSLLAPIGLHSTFNAISVLMISKEGMGS